MQLTANEVMENSALCPELNHTMVEITNVKQAGR